MRLGDRLGWLVVGIAAAAAVGLAGVVGVSGDGGPIWGVTVGMAVAALVAIRSHLVVRSRLRRITRELDDGLAIVEEDLADLSEAIRRRDDPDRLSSLTERVRLRIGRRRTSLGGHGVREWVPTSVVAQSFERRAAHWLSVRVRAETDHIWCDRRGLETALVALADEAAGRQAMSMSVTVSMTDGDIRIVLSDDGAGLVVPDPTATRIVGRMGGAVAAQTDATGNEVALTVHVPRRAGAPVTLALVTATLAILSLGLPVAAHHDPEHGGGPPTTTTTTSPTTTTTDPPTTTTTTAPTTTTTAPTTTTTAPTTTTTTTVPPVTTTTSAVTSPGPVTTTTSASITSVDVPGHTPSGVVRPGSAITTTTVHRPVVERSVVTLPELPPLPVATRPVASTREMAAIGLSAVALTGTSVIDRRWFRRHLRAVTEN